MSHYVLLRAYINGNLGDDLFIRILANRYAETQFTVVGSRKFCSYFNDVNNLRYISFDRLDKKIVEKLINILGIVTGLKFLKYFRIVNKCYQKLSSNADENILVSGSYYIEWTENREYWEHLFKTEKEYYKVKPIIMGINFGPYKTEYYYDNMIKLLGNAKFLSVREKYTCELLTELSPVYSPDIVFTMNECIEVKNNKNEVAIVVVNDRCCTEDYVKAIVDIINNDFNSEYVFRLVSFCEPEGDEVVLDRIYSLVKNKQNIKKTKYRGGNINEILSVLANAKLVIAGRYHAMILGWKFGVKVIPICYSVKMINVIHDIFPDSIFYKLEEISSIEKNINALLELAKVRGLKSVFEEAQKNFTYTDDILS